MTRAPIVEPDRGAIGAEQPVGAVTEDVEARRQVERGGRWPRTRRAARGDRAAVPRSGGAGTARAWPRTRRRSRRRRLAGQVRRGGVANPMASRPTRSVAAGERQEQRRRRAEPAGQVGHLPVGVGDKRRRARRNASTTSAASAVAGHPWIGAQLVEAEARRGLEAAVPRVVLEQQRAGAAGGVEGVLVQLRQQVDEAGRRARSDTSGRAAVAGRRRAPGRRSLRRTGQPSGSSVAGHELVSLAPDRGDCNAITEARQRSRCHCISRRTACNVIR